MIKQVEKDFYNDDISDETGNIKVLPNNMDEFISAIKFDPDMQQQFLSALLGNA